MKHLWEVDHAYYCNDANYYSNDASTEYDSWYDFIAEWGQSDLNYNLLFRWDWKKDDDGSYLHLYWMLQRKGHFTPCIVRGMRDEDEASVIEFLKPRLEHLKKLWEPLNP